MNYELDLSKSFLHNVGYGSGGERGTFLDSNMTYELMANQDKGDGRCNVHLIFIEVMLYIYLLKLIFIISVIKVHTYEKAFIERYLAVLVSYHNSKQ
jgi:hypothetical protein